MRIFRIHLMNQNSRRCHSRNSIDFYNQHLQKGEIDNGVRKIELAKIFSCIPEQVYPSGEFTSPLSTFTNASIRENPSNCKVFAISSIFFLHLSKASLLIHGRKRKILLSRQSIPTSSHAMKIPGTREFQQDNVM